MPDIRNLLQPYLSLFSGRLDKIACLDSTLKCVVGCEMLPEGENLLSYLAEAVPNPIHDITEALFYRDDKYWCCRIMPVKNSAGESDAYICEFISIKEAQNIAERADLASSVLPLFTVVESNLSKIWAGAEKLRGTLMERENFPALSDVLSVEQSVMNISTASKNAFEYAGMLLDKNGSQIMDMGALCRSLGERCNAALAKCGRHVEVFVELEELNAFADSRRATVALVNAIQNALLYSPEDTSPVMTVYQTTVHKRKYIEIKIVNENIMYTREDFRDRLDINFTYQRLGFGIPIIERFAKSCGGTFSLNHRGGKVEAILDIPWVEAFPGSYMRFDTPEIVPYVTDLPDMPEQMMLEVVRFFGEKTDIHS